MTQDGVANLSIPREEKETYKEERKPNVCAIANGITAISNSIHNSCSYAFIHNKSRALL